MTPSQENLPSKRRDKPGIIYQAKNKINGKLYVGQTVKPLARRRRDHIYNAEQGINFALPAAIRKYGADAFEFSVLEQCCCRECLNIAEQRWIAHLCCMVPNGYNLSTGGGATVMSDETCRKMSESAKATMNIEELTKRAARARTFLTKWTPERHAVQKLRKVSEETRRKQSAGLKGKKRTAETCRRMSESKKGKPQPHMIGNQYRKGLKPVMTAGTRRKISQSKTGKPRPDMLGNQFGKGFSHPNSPETRRKISESKKGKPFSGTPYKGGSRKKWAGHKSQLGLNFGHGGFAI